MSLSDLFPGKMGRVQLTRIAIRMRKPHLLKMDMGGLLDSDLLSQLEGALAEVSRG